MRKKTIFFLLGLVLLISYGQTLRMNFWRDDYAMLFRLQHPWGPGGPFGMGYIGEGAYKYSLAYSLPVYLLSSRNPFLFFLVGFLLYGLAILCFYIFSKEIFKDNKIALFSSLVFAAGNVASEGMYKIIDSWRNSFGMSSAMLCLLFFYRALTKKSIKYYLLSLLLFLAASEFVFIRSHSLIFLVIGMDFLLMLGKIKQEFKGFVVRQIPFLVIFKLYYLTGNSFSSNAIGGRFKAIFLDGKIGEITPFFSNVGNVLVSDSLQTKILNLFPSSNFVTITSITLLFILLILAIRHFRKVNIKLALITSGFLIIAAFVFDYIYAQNFYWFKDRQNLVSALLAFDFMVFSFFVSFLLWKKQRVLSIALIFSWVVILSQIFGYYSQYPDSVFPTIHRYFAYAFIGSSLLWGILAYLIYSRLKSKYRYISLTPIVLLVAVNVFLNFDYQRNFIKNISDPSRQFYSQILKEIPNPQTGDVFYFDINVDKYYQNQFGEFFGVGSMPDTAALAYYYKNDTYDVYKTTDFDEVVYRIDSGKTKIDKVYSFYFGPEGLINTTQDLRQFLTKGGSEKVMTGDDLSNLEINSVTPNLLNLDLSLSLKKPQTYPYKRGVEVGHKLTLTQRINLLRLAKDRMDFDKSVRVKSLSEWYYREAVNLIDGNETTAWQGDRLWWHANKTENLEIDLGGIKTISGIVWQNWNNSLTPTAYDIQISSDGKNWKTVKSIVGGSEKKGGFWTLDSFSPAYGRWVKIIFKKTISDDSPAMSEIYISSGETDGVDPNEVEAMLKNPFYSIENDEEWNGVVNAVKDVGQIQVVWFSDKGEKYYNNVFVPVKFNSVNRYKVIIPAGGTKINRIELVSLYPSDLSLFKWSTQNLSFNQIKNLNLVKKFKED